MTGKSNKIIGLFLASFFFFSDNLSSFYDISIDDENRHIFDHLQDVNIMKPLEDGGFHGEKLVTRAEALAFSLRAGGIEITKEINFEFLPTDINPNDWIASVVSRAQETRIISKNTLIFRPNEIINKAEFLTFLFRSAKVRINSYNHKNGEIANDIDLEEWYSPYFRYAKKYGIANPTLDNFYLPFKKMSRKEVAIIIYRQLKLFHGDETTKNFAELKTGINNFVNTLKNDENNFNNNIDLHKIQDLTRKITLQKNDHNAVAANFLGKSLQSLVKSMQNLKYGKTLNALENIHLSLNYIKKTEEKSGEMAEISKEIKQIIEQTLEKII